MLKQTRLLAAIALAFGGLFFATPAYAWDSTSGRVVDGAVQFDYRGGTASQTLQAPEGSTLTITVNNTIANCIGNCTPIPDTWSLTINGERWDGNSIDIVTIQTIVSGEVVIVATGKDEGFWGGWYGPIFSAPIITSPAPVETGTWEGQTFSATAPEGEVFTAVTGWYGAPTDSTCGADVTSVLATLLGSTTFTVGADNGVFGDPCGGVVKVLRVQLVSSVVSVDTTDSTDTTDVVDVSVDTVEPVVPVVPPIVEPPTIEPAPQPQPIPLPAPVPAPEPVPSPEPAPSPAEPAPPSAEPAPPVAEPAPIVPEPSPEPVAEPKPVVAPVEEVKPPSVLEPIKPENVKPEELTPAQAVVLVQQAEATLATEPQGSPAYNQALEMLLVVAEADDPEVPAALASIPLLGNAAVAVLDAFNQLGNFGADISPKVRKQAKKEAIATIAVGTATTASMAAGSVGYRRKP